MANDDLNPDDINRMRMNPRRNDPPKPKPSGSGRWEDEGPSYDLKTMTLGDVMSISVVPREHGDRMSLAVTFTPGADASDRFDEFFKRLNSGAVRGKQPSSADKILDMMEDQLAEHDIEVLHERGSNPDEGKNNRSNVTVRDFAHRQNDGSYEITYAPPYGDAFNANQIATMAMQVVHEIRNELGDQRITLTRIEDAVDRIHGNRDASRISNSADDFDEHFARDEHEHDEPPKEDVTPTEVRQSGIDKEALKTEIAEKLAPYESLMTAGSTAKGISAALISKLDELMDVDPAKAQEDITNIVRPHLKSDKFLNLVSGDAYDRIAARTHDSGINY